MELLVSGLDADFTFTSVLIACELGQRSSDVFIEINDLFDQFQWHRFPVKMKHILTLTMIVLQKPVSIECFGSFFCCREAFKSVCWIKFNRKFHLLNTHSHLLDFLFRFWKAFTHTLWCFVNSSNEVKWSIYLSTTADFSLFHIF